LRLDTLGLKGSVEEMVRQFDSIHSGCRFELRIGHDLPSIPEHSSIAAYRVVGAVERRQTLKRDTLHRDIERNALGG